MKKKITIIDDDDDLRTLMGLTLSSAGYEVKTYSGGSVLEDQAAETSHLYIIDINLGGKKSGLDLCKQIKDRDINGKAPIVIIISAHPDVRQLAMEACADDTLPK